MPLRSTILVIVKAKHEDIVQRRSMQVRKKIGMRGKDENRKEDCSHATVAILPPKYLFFNTFKIQ